MLFLYVLLSADVYVSTSSVQDTAPGAMNTARAGQTGPCCCGEETEHVNINQSAEREKYQMAASGMQRIQIGKDDRD